MRKRWSRSFRLRGATRVADRLHSVAIHLLRRLRKQDVAMGIGAAQASALSVLVFAGPRTLSELAAVEQVRPPTMTRIVRGLVRRGLAARTVDARDRRVARVRPTPKGIRVLQRGRRRRIAYLAKRLQRLRRRNLAVLDRAAELIEQVLRPAP